MSEKALGLIVRFTDWSETSRVVTLWTRELGKVRALAKGGRRLKSNFETALDLLTVGQFVFLRKSPETLNLLTEAQVVERFPALSTNLQALYSAYYIAELLADWTEDYDPHPNVFEAALATLRELAPAGSQAPLRLIAFELTLLHELGYSPALQACAVCERPVKSRAVFSPSAGGVLCPACQPAHRDRRPLSAGAWQALVELRQSPDAWRADRSAAVVKELRDVLGRYVTERMGRRPRLLTYLDV